MSFSDRLEQSLADQDADGIALWTEDRSMTWGELRHRVVEFRRTCEQTTAPGTAVRLRVMNDIESIVGLLATLLSGRVPILHSIHHPPPTQEDTLPAVMPDTLVFLHSSGTTGREKLIGLTQTQVAASLDSGRPRSSSRSPSLICHPVGHIAGWWALAHAMTTGRGVVLLPRFSPGPWSQAVERHRIRAAFLVPSALRMLVDADVSTETLTTLRLLTTGAAACAPELIANIWHRHRIPVLNTYGATELGGSVAGWDRELFERWWPLKTGSAGRAYPGVEITVATEDVSTPGTLRVRGAQTCGRWIDTPDLGHVDADGFLWLHGRIDDVIIRGGFKVNPERVAEALIRHPGVADAAVVGLPDRRLGMVPGAVITPGQPGVVSVAELRLHCRALLAPQECPTRFVMASLPRTTTGKVRREDLLRLFDTEVPTP